MIVSESSVFPKLKAKAAESAHLLEPVLGCWRKLMVAGKREDRMVLLLLENMVAQEKTVRENAGNRGYIAADCRAFVQKSLDILGCATWLADFYHPKAGEFGPLWGFTIKWHSSLHASSTSQWINPVCGWNYRGEDAMQIIKGIVAKSAHAVSKRDLCSKALHSYWRGMSYDFARSPDGA